MEERQSEERATVLSLYSAIDLGRKETLQPTHATMPMSVIVEKILEEYNSFHFWAQQIAPITLSCHIT
jgi:hypothetical protein